MWTAQIESKRFQKGTLQIGVIYSNGIETFSEPSIVSSLEEINIIISSRLSQLEALESLEVPLGPYEPKSNVIPVNEKEQSLTRLRELQELVRLGVFKDTDSQIVDAIEDVKENL